MFFRLVIFALLVILVDVYFYQAIKTLTKGINEKRAKFWRRTYWYSLLLTSGVAIVSLIIPPPVWEKHLRTYVFSIGFLLFAVKLIGNFFLLLDDVQRALRWIAKFASRKFSKEKSPDTGRYITRSKFLSYCSMVFAVIPFSGLLYGVFRGGYKYRVHKVRISFPDLPESFNGIRIVQLSDIHTGSFTSAEPLDTAFDLAMEQNPDIIFFTGDLVNNRADETYGFEAVYSKLKAPLGVYSVLGNHDYGDYEEWPSPEAKQKNLDELKQVHANAGWRLLLNESVKIEKGGESIALVGVENWGGSMHFPKYGKMDVAMKDVAKEDFTILLSHDPSHWNKMVRKDYTSVNLTLSGHTHGMQLGVEIPGFKWSPVQYIYPQWAGLYRDNHQHLYVNRGIGFIGYPGRLGIWPEVTVLELFRA